MNRSVRWATWLSLLLWLAASAHAETVGQLAKLLNSAPSPQKAALVVEQTYVPELEGNLAFQSLKSDLHQHEDQVSLNRLRAYVNLLVRTEPIDKVQAREEIRKIKKSPSYRTDAKPKTENWLGRALDRIGRWLTFRGPSVKSGPSTSWLGALGHWMTVLMWLVLCGAVIAALVALARFVRFRRRRKTATALIDESEPDRSSDEWIENADALAAQGKYREAVRSLYLASMVRLDEAGVIQIRRGETNWEHYRQYESSSRRPLALDMERPTRQFDLIWYGFHCRGEQDFNEFKEVYGRVCQAVKELLTA